LAAQKQQKYLDSQTGTIWAQSSFGKNNDIFFLNRPFGHQNSRFKPKKWALFLA
jgi:hypothetical protein